MFGNRSPFRGALTTCATIFPELEFTRESLALHPIRINAAYGGLTPNVRKIIFTYGELDPTRLNGVTEKLNDDVVTIVVPGFGKGREVHSINIWLDHPTLIKVKQQIRQQIIDWIYE